MSEPLLLRALGTNDGATDVLVVSDVVFAEQLASVSLARLPPPCTRTHARVLQEWMDGLVPQSVGSTVVACTVARAQLALPVTGIQRIQMRAIHFTDA
jgi:predicted nicotinamide N-methyase